MEYVLTTNQVVKQYKHFKALNGLSLHVPKGAIYGFVGKNGSGKTTLIRVISGLQRPTSGEYSLYGVKSTQQLSKVRRRMGAVVETPAIYGDMSARENLKEQYKILGMPSDEGLDELLTLVGLEDVGKKKAKHFSLGMKQRLGIAIALCGNPDFLVLDEPINGLDPQGIIEMRELILRLNREHQITVMISSHILDELSRLATHYGFIDSGCMVKEISAEELAGVCRKCIRLTVSNMKMACLIVEQLGLEYSVISDEQIDIYGEISVTKLTMALNEKQCEIHSLSERDESLEDYYMNLIGGGSHA